MPATPMPFGHITQTFEAAPVAHLLLVFLIMSKPLGLTVLFSFLFSCSMTWAAELGENCRAEMHTATSLERIFGKMPVETRQQLDQARERIAKEVEAVKASIKRNSATYIRQAQETGRAPEVDVVVIGAGPTSANFLYPLVKQGLRILVLEQAEVGSRFNAPYLINSGQPMGFGGLYSSERPALNEILRALVVTGFSANPFGVDPFTVFTGFKPHGVDNRPDASVFKQNYSAYAPPELVESWDAMASYIGSIGGRLVEQTTSPQRREYQSPFRNSGVVYFPLQAVQDALYLTFQDLAVPVVEGVQVQLPTTIDEKITEVKTSQGFVIPLSEHSVVLHAGGLGQVPSLRRKVEAPFSIAASEKAEVLKRVETTDQFYQRIHDGQLDEYAGLTVGVIGVPADGGLVTTGALMNLETGVPPIEGEPVKLVVANMESNDPEHLRQKIRDGGSAISRGPFHHLRYSRVIDNFSKAAILPGKVTAVSMTEDGRLKMTSEDGGYAVVDRLIYTVGYKSKLPRGKVQILRAEQLDQRIDDLEDADLYAESGNYLGLHWEGTNFALAGPSIPNLFWADRYLFSRQPIGSGFNEAPYEFDIIYNPRGTSISRHQADNRGLWHFPNPSAMVNVAPLARSLGLVISRQGVYQRGWQSNSGRASLTFSQPLQRSYLK